MVAERIIVGVYALDDVLLPRAAAGQGWPLRLADQDPALAPGAKRFDLILEVTAEGLALAEPAALATASHAAGLRVAIEPVPGRTGLYLVRVGPKPVAVAVAGSWQSALLPGEVQAEAVAAYVAGTLIDTPDRPRAVETLVVGDVVTTLANGSRPLRWVGRRRVSALELLAHPALRPVEFAAGTVGNTRPLVVSPQQRMLIDDWRAEVYFGEDRVLVAAQALVDDQAARVVLPAEGVEYVVLLCDRHELLLAEGALSESFHAGEMGLSGLTAAERAEVEAVIPEAELLRRRAAFPIVRNAEARALRL
ncbi:Hint domain-containing protein [Tabrizicola sp.]|uniref:Hint domain-containing protein n=1 Tax=Tabrizicola sp. TaxID=2005166 RepID=UPI002733C5C8|nr:Hint domain-containing protein [Tabrizicola sp.]MDP3195131.1 Hint domain-containing protein [Tabrizicola sp.]